ncbi:LCP family protein [Candidatus Daviesbacteria bacterium]|nr:LCP family protein [Candidatus Daviesbacteria bacterium]
MANKWLLIAGGLLIFLVLFYLSPLIELGKHLISGPGVVFSFILPDGLKSNDGRTNVLLLGTGGTGHEGPNLTDSLMVVSVGVKQQDIALVSLPRDIWIDSLSAKINAAYAFGEEKKAGGGKILARSTIAEVLGIPIHYVLRVDFAGFRQAIDLLGGIDVLVDRSFEDLRYPTEGKETDSCGYIEEKRIEKTIKESSTSAKKETIEQEVIYYIDATGSAKRAEDDPYSCRFEKITFSKGLQHMDGQIALRFVRSRDGTHGEGSDFARAKRQQKVLLALKDKVFSVPTFLDPGKLASLIKTFANNVDTDIGADDIGDLVKLSGKIDFAVIKHVVLTDEENGLLFNPPPQDYQGAWVLVPKVGNWSEVASYIKRELFSQEKDSPQEE